MSQGGIGELQLLPGWDVNLSRDYPPQHVFGTHLSSMWKTADISDAISGFPAKWHLGNERRNSILMTCRYPDLGSALDWLNPTARPNRSTTTYTFWVVTPSVWNFTHFTMLPCSTLTLPDTSMPISSRTWLTMASCSSSSPDSSSIESNVSLTARKCITHRS